MDIYSDYARLLNKNIKDFKQYPRFSAGRLLLSIEYSLLLLKHDSDPEYKKLKRLSNKHENFKQVCEFSIKLYEHLKAKGMNYEKQ